MFILDGIDLGPSYEEQDSAGHPFLLASFLVKKNVFPSQICCYIYFNSHLVS